jgi:hypothetical protein
MKGENQGEASRVHYHKISVFLSFKENQNHQVNVKSHAKKISETTRTLCMKSMTTAKN